MADNIGINIRDTVSKAMEGWLYRYKQNGVKVATFNRLTTSFKLLLNYSIADVRLMDLCTDDIQRFINALRDDGYSLSTIKKAYNLMTGFISFLLGEGLAIRPAHMNVVLPRPENVKLQAKQIQAYEPDEQERLKSAIAASNTMGAKAALLMLETGMRAGEVLALRWSDILWQRRAVRIHATLVNSAGRKRCFIQNSPKSKSSNRVIPLSSAALEMLAGMKRNGDNLIFTTDDNETTIGYNTLRNHVKAVCQMADVRYLGMHVFRHTFATNTFYKGCDIKILSKMLGHSSVTITYNTYIHLYGDALEDMRNLIS